MDRPLQDGPDPVLLMHGLHPRDAKHQPVVKRELVVTPAMLCWDRMRAFYCETAWDQAVTDTGESLAINLLERPGAGPVIPRRNHDIKSF